VRPHSAMDLRFAGIHQKFGGAGAPACQLEMILYTMSNRRPRIAMVLGDPAGIGPELVAKLLANAETLNAADVLLVADASEMRRAMSLAQCEIEMETATSYDDVSFHGKPVLMATRTPAYGGFERGVTSAKAGRYCLDTLSFAVAAARQGVVDAVVFAPLNKHSLHLAGMSTSDELHWFADTLGFQGPVSEFNVLDDLWTSRVTSHIALRAVADAVTCEGVLTSIGLLQKEILRCGIKKPRLAVCGLNPHNGDYGSFGREEIDVIAPAVALARAQGIDVEGPFAADTIFLKVQGGRREYDGVVTMYHDQGQIAMKLMGFARGITVQGGLPLPILTPAHGTAFDIAGRGVADPGAIIKTFQLACLMAGIAVEKTKEGSSSHA